MSCEIEQCCIWLKCFGGTYSLHHQVILSIVQMNATVYSETLATTYKTTHYHNSDDDILDCFLKCFVMFLRHYFKRWLFGRTRAQRSDWKPAIMAEVFVFFLSPSGQMPGQGLFQILPRRHSITNFSLYAISSKLLKKRR
jgi:hypothetical protein